MPPFEQTVHDTFSNTVHDYLSHLYGHRAGEVQRRLNQRLEYFQSLAPITPTLSEARPKTHLHGAKKISG